MMIRLGWACVALLTVLVLAAAASAQDGVSCPAGWTRMFNTNGPGCTFCYNPDDSVCQVSCLGPPACKCPEGELEACCAETPCCENCPNSDALECNVFSCQCEPGSCCRTICPARQAAPAIGTPTSLPFVGAAALLALAGLWHIARRRRSDSF
jgi:MYXO-CTERM domain-containing protein